MPPLFFNPDLSDPLLRRRPTTPAGDPPLYSPTTCSRPSSPSSPPSPLQEVLPSRSAGTSSTNSSESATPKPSSPGPHLTPPFNRRRPRRPMPHQLRLLPFPVAASLLPSRPRRFSTLHSFCCFFILAGSSPATSFLRIALLLHFFSAAVADTCLALYRSGGARAVFDSPDCPDWSFPVVSVPEPVVRSSPGCHPTALQGRRRYMEDRPVCALGIPVSLLGSEGVKEISGSLVAVFDGHNGAEASELSSRVVVDYFLLHAHFLSNPLCSLSSESHDGRLINWNQSSDSISDKSYQLQILGESVLRTLHDIENEFFEKAYEIGSPAGTTASVALIAYGQIFVANIGDSKSFLCSQGHTQDQAHSFYAKELTVDHHPDREDERARVEVAGGYVSVRNGIAFINGGFPLSRAIGDLPMRGLGVIPVPEVTDWQPLSEEDIYLVVASDGIFERLTTYDVCKLLQDVPKVIDDASLSKHIVNAAYEGGSSDNLSAIVIPVTTLLKARSS